ncbi:hypothetical protein ACTQ54_03160 [Fundicoccus sp. Sow4_H7]|uniref:hypothetical protein n=1 Tax=Fundicoccus sp. Sow4_H7 TaxID=3438784 RepID=UPI003F91A54C
MNNRQVRRLYKVFGTLSVPDSTVQEEPLITTDSPLAFQYLNRKQQKVLLDYCNSLQKSKRVNKKRSSVDLKEMFEVENSIYITNGAFKGAMYLAGFTIDDIHADEWYFNVSEKGFKKMEFIKWFNKTIVEKWLK